MRINNIVKRTAAGATAAALSVGIIAAAAGPASADIPKYNRAHHVSATVNFDVHQNNIFHKADRKSTKTGYQHIGRGDYNGENNFKVYLESDPADDTFGQERIYVTEADSSGTIHVFDDQTLNFWHANPVSSHLNLDIAPNATRSFWIYTDGAGGDYVHSLVTITNKVS